MASCNTTIIPPKPPPRPFTEYHIFCQLERNYILQTSDKSSHIDTTIDFAGTDPHASTRPPRYRSLILPKQWHANGSRPKRRSHRKTHGKISFVELTKLISQRWKGADQVTRGYCRELAGRELKRYREEMKEYVERYGEEAIRLTKVGKKKEKKKDTKKEKLVQDNINLLLKNQDQATMLAPQAQVSVTSPQTFSQLCASGVGMQPQPQQPSLQQLHQQQLDCLNCQNQLEMCHQLQNQMDIMMKMQCQAQAVHHANTMMPQVNVKQGQHGVMDSYQFNDHGNMNRMMVHMQSQIQARNMHQDNMMMPRVNVNQHGMMDSYQFNDHGNMNRMMTMTTVKDEGQLPPLFEDQEYHDFPSKNDCYDNCVMDCNNQYPPQGPHQGKFDDDFGLFDGDTEELPAASFDDYSIVGPMGIWPKSPTASPPPTDGKASDEPGTPRTPGGNVDIRAKSISPMPDYNIAPEISFLAKNFVNEFSRYLNHDHDVQKSELDAINIDNIQGGVLDHQGMEKQALNGMFNCALNGGVGTQEEGMQEVKGTAAPRDKDLSGIGNNNMVYCLPVGVFESDLSKPIKKRGFVNKGCSPDVSNKHTSRAAPSVDEFSKRVKEMFDYPPPPPDDHKTKKQLEGSSSGTMSRDTSRADIQAWLNDVLA